MENLEIGVVIPTLNSAKTLDWTLASLSQHENISVQVVVVDSGSTDKTLDICERWRIDTIYVPPGNMYQAINVGIRSLRTEWLTYLNSDDYMYVGAYHRLMSLGEEAGADLVYGDCDFNNMEGQFLYSLKAVSEKSLQHFFEVKQLGFSQPATIFRKDVFGKLDGFSERFRLVADLDFFCRAYDAGMKYSKLSGAPVASFRLHVGQLSGNRNNMEQERREIAQDVGQGLKFIYGFYLFVWWMSNLSNYVMRLFRRRYVKFKFLA